MNPTGLASACIARATMNEDPVYRPDVRHARYGCLAPRGRPSTATSSTSRGVGQKRVGPMHAQIASVSSDRSVLRIWRVGLGAQIAHQAEPQRPMTQRLRPAAVAPSMAVARRNIIAMVVTAFLSC
jgi:hypothetical protein